MPKLALCMITSAADREKATALGESLRPYVDEVIITGPEEFTWCDDFAAARKFNFSQTTADWILWLDADDTLEHPEKLRDLVKYAETNKISGYFFKYRYAFDERGNCTEEHWKLQFVKNDGHAIWKGAIHEDLLQQRPTRWVKVESPTRIHHTDNSRAASSHERNLRILLQERLRDPKEPRTLFYLGRTYIALGELQKAVDALEEYLTLSGWDDERYEASVLIGTCLLTAGSRDEALLAFNQAILEKESNPDAFIQKGIVYMQQEQWNDALCNFKHALGMQTPDSATFQNPMLYSRDVYSAIAVCYMHLGLLDDALKAVKIVLHTDPQNTDIRELGAFLLKEQNKLSTAQKYVEIAKYLDKPEKIQQLLATVPADLSDNEMILALRNTFVKPTVWPAKSIAVYCGASAEHWTPDSQNTGGIGGSETAVIELTKRFAKLGWDVTVFNDCNLPPEGQTFDGVKYQNYWTFNTKDEFDVLWVWRLPELFDYDLKANFKILDLHDVMSPMDFTPERIKSIDQIFVKTHYHRSLFPNVPDEKFTIINNGINLTRFAAHVEKEPHRFVYTSSPNRGLDVLLKMWPKIRDAIPDAELHIYYGWNTFYALEKNNPERVAWMKKIQAQVNQPGVIDHGRVGQAELASELLKSSYWLYPTYFPEISCITAMEMQAAGVVPITTGYAALAETQVTGLKLPGDPYDPQWQQEYIEQVINQASAPLIDTRPFAEQFSWDSVATNWDRTLCA